MRKGEAKVMRLRLQLISVLVGIGAMGGVGVGAKADDELSKVARQEWDRLKSKRDAVSDVSATAVFGIPHPNSAGTNLTFRFYESRTAGLCRMDLMRGSGMLLRSFFVDPKAKRVTGVNDIGSEEVGKSRAEVFLLRTRPTRDERLWVGIGDGLMRQAQWQGTFFRLADVRTNVETDRVAALRWTERRGGDAAGAWGECQRC